MAQQENLRNITRPAGADLSTTGQYRFVELNGSGQVTVCNAAGELSLGVLQNAPSAAGQAATVAVDGVIKVIAGSGGLAPNNKVTTDNQGRGVVAASTNHVLGIALSTAASGELAEVKLGCPGILA